MVSRHIISADCETVCEASTEIERLRAQAKVFIVKPDEVLVLVAPDDMPLELAGRLLEHAPQALAGRVFVVSGLGARCG